MERDIVDIVLEKSYLELTQEERNELAELCAGEDEFNQLKHVFSSIEALEFDAPRPSDQVKERLDHLFTQTYPKAAPVWYNSVLAVVVPKDKPLYKQPLLQIAAVVVLILLVFPFAQDNISHESNLVAEVDKDSMVQEQSTGTSENEGMDGSTFDRDAAGEVPVMTEVEDISGTGAVNSSEAMATMVVGETVPAAAFSGSFARTGVQHPDGIYMGDIPGNTSYSLSAGETSDVLDLLTATF